MNIKPVDLLNLRRKPIIGFSKNCQNNSNTTNQNAGYKKNSLECFANYNKANISFTSKADNMQPAKKLFYIASGRNTIEKDELTDAMAWRVNTSVGQKTWSTVPPKDLLKRSIEETIQSICTLNDTYEIPDKIGTPNYGNNWGRRANYIEINPRLLGRTEGDKISEGLLNTIKILPAIPPSTKNIPTCIMLSQLFPTQGNWHDGQTGDIGIYSVDLDHGISKSLTSPDLKRDGLKMNDEEIVRAFNDLAHFRGFKTCLRMPISEGQMTVNWRSFNWAEDTDAYIDACCHAIELGFDSIYFDSGKHVGGYEMEHYCGCGYVPDYEKMQYITHEIRRKTGRFDIAFAAEKTNTDPRFENLGYTAGTDWGMADNPDNLWHEYHNQAWNSNYAAGPIISDDNDDGSMTYEQRLERTKNAFSTFDDPYKKLPVFMQLHDIFPLKEDINTHGIMMESSNRSPDGSAEGHYDNIFASSDAAYNQTMNMFHEFEKIMDK